MPEPERQRKFKINQKIQVDASGGWPNSPTGVVTSPPEDASTAEGPDYLYGVRFDAEQPDSQGGGPYAWAQILSRFLAPLEG